MESAEADREEPLFENETSALFLSALADTSFAPGFSRGRLRKKVRVES